MAGALNKVILIGNLGRDPELRKTPGGASVTDFSIATTERFTDKNGQRQEQTEWHNIVVWNRQAETAAQYLKKGSSVYIEGKLRTRSWEDNGQKRYRTEIIASNFQFLDSRSGGGGQGGFGGGAGNFGEPPMSNDQGFGGGGADQGFGGGGADQGFGGGGADQGFGGGGADQGFGGGGADQGFGGGGQSGGGQSFGGGNQSGFGASGGSAPMPNTSAPFNQGAAPQTPTAPAGLPVEDELPF